MSRGLNKLMIIGHLGRDPEMRYTPSGRPVTTFSVATSRSWHSADGERHEETEWFEGRLQTRRWEDSEGNKHYTTELVAKEMIMLGDKRETYTAEDQDDESEGEALPF
jgi:single-strand DNA-binding protein